MEEQKMKKIKNSAVLMLSLCVATSMCACSKSDATEETTKSETTATTTEATTTEDENEEETDDLDFEMEEEGEDSYSADVERVEGTGETLLGFDNWYLEKESAGEAFNIWTFYNAKGEPFAVQFGFDNGPGPKYTVADFDGDGKDDIICNNQFGGDGAMRVYVFRNNGGTVEVGQEAVSGDLCVLAYDVTYDPDKKEITFSNYDDGTEKIITADDFQFTTWDEAELW